MKKVLKILAGVIIAILVAVTAVGAYFVSTNYELAKGAFDLLLSAPGNNIKAAWLFITTNSEELDQKLNDNAEKYNTAVSDVVKGEDGTTTLTPEVLEALNSGNYTEEEMTRIITLGAAELEKINLEKQQAQNAENNDSVEDPAPEQVPETKSEDKTEINEEKPSETTAPAVNDKTEHSNAPISSAPQNPVQNPPAQTEDPGVVHLPAQPAVPDPEQNGQQQSEQIAPEQKNEHTSEQPVQEQQSATDDTAASIAKLYVVKSRFVTELGSLESTIRKSYEALPKDQRVPASRKAIAGQYISSVAALESQCDAEVDQILADLTSKLEAAGKDTAVVETLRKAYENEKSIKKAYYMDVYMNGI